MSRITPAEQEVVFELLKDKPSTVDELTEMLSGWGWDRELVGRCLKLLDAECLACPEFDESRQEDVWRFQPRARAEWNDGYSARLYGEPAPSAATDLYRYRGWRKADRAIRAEKRREEREQGARLLGVQAFDQGKDIHDYADVPLYLVRHWQAGWLTALKLSRKERNS